MNSSNDYSGSFINSEHRNAGSFQHEATSWSGEYQHEQEGAVGGVFVSERAVPVPDIRLLQIQMDAIWRLLNEKHSVIKKLYHQTYVFN